MAGTSENTNKMLGPDEHEILTATGADAEPTSIKDCNYIWMDTGGIIKVSYGNGKTMVLTCPTQQYVPVRNVSKLHRYYTGTTQGTGECWGNDGVTIVNAIKIFRTILP